MKVIFLDVDGVLNSEMWNENHQYEIQNGVCIDETKVELLSMIIKKTGAVIVLHSGWRFWLDDKLKPLNREADYLLFQFKKYGIAIHDITPDFSTDEIKRTKKFSLVKAGEIIDWIRVHHVTKYLVLDDLDLFMDEIIPYQIRTNPAAGLTEQDAEEAIEKLNGFK